MTEHGMRPYALGQLRWVIAPIGVALFALVGLAISTEDRETFRAAQELDELQAEPVTDPGDQADATAADAPGDDRAMVSLEYDGGRADVELGGSAPLVSPRSPTDGAPLSDRAIPIPRVGGPRDPDGGYRLTEDGGIEAVERAGVEPGEAALRAVGIDGSGVDVLQSDGSYTEIRLRPPTDTTDIASALAFTHVDPNGISTRVEPGPDGRLELPGGITISAAVPPTIGGAVAGETGGDEPDDTDDEPSIDPTRIVVLLALSAVAGSLLFLLRRPRKTPAEEEPFGPDFVGTAGIPDDRFDEFVAMLAADRDPARAIRLAFSAAERGVGGLPPRITTETSFEWCERVATDRVHLATPLRSLGDRFARTRFAAEQPTVSDRDAAIVELVELRRLADGPQAEPAVPVGGPTDHSRRTTHR